MKYIELINLSKSYDGKRNIINKINVDINKGEFFVLVGPSGCGKSTLLRMIAGLEEISDGILKIDNIIVNNVMAKDRNISFVFQNYALYPHMTVKENILFGLDLKKVSKDEQNRRLMETADIIGLSDLLNRKPGQLSGGQRQRVALARSICSEAAICLMDEPLSNLDAKLRAHMRSEIRRIHKKFNLTTIYVTHDQVEAMTMGDRIMVLNEGKIQQVGSPLELYNKPSNKFVASFIGSPQMNILNAHINDNRIFIDNQIVAIIDKGIKEKIKEDKIIIGIRPESLGLLKNDNGKAYKAKIDNVEFLGNETQVSFLIGENILIARWVGQINVNIGDEVYVSLNLKDFHFFNSNNEMRIEYYDEIKCK
ncbi:ABC transporter ATP-binding protein [Clostridium tertium]|uniref:ABC transporter ATP-binding protein n=1 Tax=Clostridium tertium TaxID=1559 RepID=UPI0024B39037|nr:sn-glycerol-3-phosphate ABC transporter ATP-binding protein UgpC [Clostridium tertium]MDI9218144.1 sn-glycerol-3-phosphate ABC transporter ATP-binding protein UgpC [Clostridium tertium]